MLVKWQTERERRIQHLRDNPPDDAGKEYGNPDGLLAYLPKLSKSEIADLGIWIKMHYINTESLIMQIRKIHHCAKK